MILSVLAALACSDDARGQESPPQVSEADILRARGRLAWRRAAWRLRRDEWLRAVDVLEAARRADSAAGVVDFGTLYLLGAAYLRLAPSGVGSSKLDAADIVLHEARRIDPKFPGFAFTDGLRETLLPENPSAAGATHAELAVERFGAFIRDFGRPEDFPFGFELLFLGHYYRARSQARDPGGYDTAVIDLNKARSLADSHGQTPPTEVVSLLAQVYKNLNQGEDAKRVVADALRRNPADAPNYYNFGQLLVSAHDLTGARSWFEAALLRQPGFPEARIALADIARRMNDSGAMRRHLEAARALLEMNAKAGNPIESGFMADVECGFGICWKMIGDQRSEAGDDVGMREAFARATTHFVEARVKQSGCFNAVNYLIQIKARTGAPEEEVEALKKELERLQKPTDRASGTFRSTFC